MLNKIYKASYEPLFNTILNIEFQIVCLSLHNRRSVIYRTQTILLILEIKLANFSTSGL